MIKIFIKIISTPFRKISKKARKNKLRPETNRKHVGKTLFFLVIAMFTIFAFRFVWLITVNKVGKTNLAEASKYNHTAIQTLNAVRGTIFDRNGVPIATDGSTYKIYAIIDKTQVDSAGNDLFVSAGERDKVADLLNSQLGIDKVFASQQLENKKQKQVEFGTKGSNINLATKEKIEKLIKDEKIKGLSFSETLARYYTNGTSPFASHFIGIASAQPQKDGTNLLQGTSGGIEQSFDSTLSGVNGVVTYEKDARGLPIPGTEKELKKVKNGQDVYTTLDAQIQQQLESLIDAQFKKTGSQQLSVTLMDVKTGDIIATSQRPTFSPDTLIKDQKQDNFNFNSELYQGTFEPGSTMKTFLMASALDSGKVDLNGQYDRKTFTYLDSPISDWDWNEKEKYIRPEIITYAQGFAYSSNVGMSKIERNMGSPLWTDYLKKFRFGTRARIGMEYEQPGQVPGKDQPTSELQSSFGQGIAVTQIQMLRGWTAIGNNGVMYEPHVVSKVVNNDSKTVLSNAAEIIGKPIGAEAANKTLALMQTVNTDNDYGTANYGLFSGKTPGPIFTVNGDAAAVKTGTAQIADEKKGGYMNGVGNVLNSVVAMYPVENPDFIVYVTNKIPKNFQTFDTADIVNPLLAKAMLLKDQIRATSSNLKSGKVTLPDYTGKSPGDTSDKLRQTLLEPVILGDGTKIKDQSLKAQEQVSANTRILLLTNGKHTMPDMYGWSKKEVEQLATWYGLKVTYQGDSENASAKVSSQSIAMNDTPKSGASLTVKLG